MLLMTASHCPTRWMENGSSIAINAQQILAHTGWVTSLTKKEWLFSNPDNTEVLIKSENIKGNMMPFVKELLSKVYRDKNKDNVYDLNDDNVHEGIFGINIHRATAKKGGKSWRVDKWSAGCQVIADPMTIGMSSSVSVRKQQRFGVINSPTLY